MPKKIKRCNSLRDFLRDDIVTLMRFTPKKIAILVAGMVFTAGLAVSFVVPAFAGEPVGGLDITIEQIPGGRVSAKNYSSSLSNKSVGKVRQEVGDILLRYGVGGADINKVTDVLEGGGVYEAELKSFLIAIGVNEKGVQEVLAKLDELGAGADSTTAGGAVSTPAVRDGAVSAPATGGGAGAGKVEVAPDTGDFQPLATGILARLNRPGNDAEALRDNFRENVKTIIGHVDHGKTARIAVAHGRGLRMLNRFRSAMARFDHILGRLESRIEKIRIEIEGEKRGIYLAATIPLLEKAKNMQIENEAKMEELKAKYESLLLGENTGGIAKEARALATELKAEIENLYAQLREISLGIPTVRLEINLR